MRFPTKSNRPGEIPQYSKAGLGKVPETRLQQYDLPKVANIGEAWKDVVGTGTKLYAQYEKIQDTNYTTIMEPRYRDAYLKANQQAMEKHNPLDDTLNYSKNVYADTEKIMQTWEKENFDEKRPEANAALIKQRKIWMLQDLDTANNFAAKAQQDYGIMATEQAMDGALTVVKTQYGQDVSRGGGVYNSAYSTSKIKDGNVIISREELEKNDLHYNGIGDACAKAEAAMYEQNYKQWKGMVISTDTYTKNVLAIPEMARKGIYQHVLDEAEKAYLNGDYSQALRLVRALPDAVKYTESTLIMTKDGVFGVKPEYGKVNVVTESTKNLPKNRQKYEAQYVPMSFYEKRNQGIEKAGASDGVQVFTNRTSILTGEEQQKFINAASKLEANILHAQKLSALENTATYDPQEVKNFSEMTPSEQMNAIYSEED